MSKDSANQSTKPLPPPGPRKSDPVEREKILDEALEESMAASDPPSTVMPEVKRKN
ncbi:MAG: hypothetical protein ABIS45_07885 [Burkholderiales bacterium]